MKRSHGRRSCGAVLVLLVLSACSSGPSIRVSEHGKIDPSRHQTYGFHEAVLAQAQGDSVPALIKAAIDREMRSRGYRQAEVPDLLVNFHLQTQEKDSVSTSPASYFGWREGYHWAADPVRDQEIVTYTAGTLNVDIVDRARHELLWEAVAVGHIKKAALANPEPAIDAVIAQMFQRYPLSVQRAATP